MYKKFQIRMASIPKKLKNIVGNIRYVYSSKREVILQREDLKERHIKDKFFMRATDSYMKKEFPLGYEIKYSIIKEKYSLSATHRISVKGEMDNSLSIYTSTYGTDPDELLKHVIKEIIENKNIYEDKILTNSKFSRSFLMLQMAMAIDHREHKGYETLEVEELGELVSRAIKKYDDPAKIYQALINNDYEKISKQKIKRIFNALKRESKDFVQILHILYKGFKKGKFKKTLTGIIGLF